MKLKEAIKIAKEQGCKWVAVDSDGEIYGYKHPHPPSSELVPWWVCEDRKDRFRIAGLDGYTGSKNWKDTLIEVK